MRKQLTNLTVISTLLILCLFIVAPAFGVGNIVSQNCVVFWNANPEPDIQGYKLFIGTAPGAYGPPQSIVSPNLSITCVNAGITTLGQYYVTLTAYDKAGNESPKAGEIPFVLADLVPPGVPVGLEIKELP
jgi:hypothetical protein